MTLTLPEGVPTLGATKVKAVVTIATQTAPVLTTEINAAGSLDLSLYLYPEGWAPTGATGKGSRPPRLGSKSQREIFNRTTYSMGTLRYVYDPQGPTTGVNAARTLLAAGTKIHLVERRGLDAETVAFVATDKVRDHYVVLGAQIESGDNTDENGEFYIMQDAIYFNSQGPVAGVIT